MTCLYTVQSCRCMLTIHPFQPSYIRHDKYIISLLCNFPHHTAPPIPSNTSAYRRHPTSIPQSQSILTHMPLLHVILYQSSRRRRLHLLGCGEIYRGAQKLFSRFSDRTTYRQDGRSSFLHFNTPTPYSRA